MSLDTFVLQYIETAFWATNADHLDPEGTGAEGSLDRHFSIDDIAPEAMAEIRSDCHDFYRSNCYLFESAGMSDSDAAHDFYLTRNGTGASFLDRQWSEPFGHYARTQWREHYPDRVAANAALRLLYNAAKTYGTQEPYAGDDNLIYVHN